MPESKTQRNARLKAMRKKFGLGEFSKKKKKSGSSKLRRTRMPKKKRKVSRKSSGIKTGALVTGAGVYGAIREPMSNLVANISSKLGLPNLFGNISDEVSLLAVHMWANKNLKGKFVKDITSAGAIVESASLGEALIGGRLKGMLGTSNGVGSGSVSFNPTLG